MEHLAGMKLTAAQVPSPNYHFPVTKRKKKKETIEPRNSARTDAMSSQGATAAEEEPFINELTVGDSRWGNYMGLMTK